MRNVETCRGSARAAAAARASRLARPKPCGVRLDSVSARQPEPRWIGLQGNSVSSDTEARVTETASLGNDSGGSTRAVDDDGFYGSARLDGLAMPLLRSGGALARPSRGPEPARE